MCREITRFAQSHTGSDPCLATEFVWNSQWYLIPLFFRVFRGNSHIPQPTHLALPGIQNGASSASPSPCLPPYSSPPPLLWPPPKLGSFSSLFSHSLSPGMFQKTTLQYGQTSLFYKWCLVNKPLQGLSFEPCKILIIWDSTNSIFVIFSGGSAGLEYDSVSKLFFSMNHKFIV